MNHTRVLIVGLALMLNGCSPGPPSANTPARSLDPAQVAQQIATLQDQLGEARKKLEAQYIADPKVPQGCFTPPFALSAPSDVGGYVIQPVQTQDLRHMGASVTVRLVDQGNPDHWIDFRQAMECNGVLVGAPEGSKNVEDYHAVDVPGLDTQKQIPHLQGWMDHDGNRILQLLWCGDCYASVGPGYQVTGHNVTEEALFKVAGSLKPVE
jgi:hypothetical protein